MARPSSKHVWPVVELLLWGKDTTPWPSNLNFLGLVQSVHSWFHLNFWQEVHRECCIPLCGLGDCPSGHLLEGVGSVDLQVVCWSVNGAQGDFYSFLVCASSCSVV